MKMRPTRSKAIRKYLVRSPSVMRLLLEWWNCGSSGPLRRAVPRHTTVYSHPLAHEEGFGAAILHPTTRVPYAGFAHPSAHASGRGYGPRAPAPERTAGSGLHYGARPTASTPRPASILHRRAHALGDLGSSRVPDERHPRRPVDVDRTSQD